MIRSLDLRKILTFCVGEKAVKYTVAQSVVTRSSAKVQLAVERQEKRIALRGHEAKSFEGYLQWLYEHKITTTKDAESDWCELCKLYFLGDYLADTEFCNAIVDDMVSRLPNNSPDYASTQLVWSKTTAESSLRQLFLHMWSTDAPSSVISFLKDHEDSFDGFVVDYLDCMVISHELESPTFDSVDVKGLATTFKSQLERDRSRACTSTSDDSDVLVEVWT